MPSAQQVLDVARAEIGQGENPRGSNRTKYGRWFGFDGVAWCSMFACYVLNAAGAGNLVAGAKTAKGSAYSGDVLEHFRRQGRVSMSPQPGDLVVWDWPGVGTNNDHIGFVEVVYTGAQVGTIEGNSPGSGFSYDVVGRHVRDRYRSVRGYCHPAYSGATSAPPPRTPPPPAPKKDEDEMQMFVRGDQTPTVYLLSEKGLLNVKSAQALADLNYLGFGHSPLPAGTKVETNNGVKVLIVAQRLVDELLSA